MPLSLEPLVTVSDMTDLGYDPVDVTILARVSAKVRRTTGQTISAATSTATGYSPMRLPQYPVRSITSVTTESGVELGAESWNLRGQVLTGPVSPGINDFEINLDGRGATRHGWLTVVYESGWDTLPDTLIELLCSIAARIASGEGVAAAGIREKHVGDQSLTFSAEALSLHLTDLEQQQLTALFPARSGPRTIALDPPW
ncbi:MAG: hypothetical protein AB7I38_14430 [Dehalococcoidia bacterium]